MAFTSPTTTRALDTRTGILCHKCGRFCPGPTNPGRFQAPTAPVLSQQRAARATRTAAHKPTGLEAAATEMASTMDGAGVVEVDLAHLTQLTQQALLAQGFAADHVALLAKVRAVCILRSPCGGGQCMHVQVLKLLLPSIYTGHFACVHIPNKTFRIPSHGKCPPPPAQVLLYAELRDNSQGLIKLACGDFRATPNAQSPLRQPSTSPMAGRIDGRGAPGMVALDLATRDALAKARMHGVGIVGSINTSTGTGALG